MRRKCLNVPYTPNAAKEAVSPEIENDGPKVDPRLIHILSDPIRGRFLELLSDQTSLTPVEALRRLGDGDIGLDTLAYHARVLTDFKLVELVKDPRSEEGFAYRLTPKAYVEDTLWHTIPSALKPVAWAAALQALLKESVAALEAGTIQRHDSQLNLLPLVLDQQGWRKVIGTLAESLFLVEEARQESIDRARDSAEGGLNLSPTWVVLAAFESSPTEESAPA